jgi:1-deoxy-D-xylulose-5-phosphate synthase
MKPFCNIYSSFAQRAYDEIVHDVALQNLPVVLCFDRAGLVGEDGATHHGCFDLAAYRSIPNTVIAAPRNERELKNLMYTGLSQKGGPYIIRYPRGCGEGVDWKDAPFENLPVGKGERLLEGKDVAVLALGPVANRAFEAALRHKTDYWVAPSVYDMRWLKPLDTSILEEVSGCRVILTLEDGALKGGLYSAVCEYFAGYSEAPIVKGLGIPDKFIAQDTQAAQWAECCLDTESIYGILVDLLKK